MVVKTSSFEVQRISDGDVHLDEEQGYGFLAFLWWFLEYLSLCVLGWVVEGDLLRSDLVEVLDEEGTCCKGEIGARIVVGEALGYKGEIGARRSLKFFF